MVPQKCLLMWNNVLRYWTCQHFLHYNTVESTGYKLCVRYARHVLMLLVWCLFVCIGSIQCCPSWASCARLLWFPVALHLSMHCSANEHASTTSSVHVLVLHQSTTCSSSTSMKSWSVRTWHRARSTPLWRWMVSETQRWNRYQLSSSELLK